LLLEEIAKGWWRSGFANGCFHKVDRNARGPS
jgi:hypothetical protein